MIPRLGLRLTLAVFVCALLPGAAHASNDMQSWLTVAGKVDLDHKTEATLDVVLRSNSDSFDIGQSNVRVGVRRDIGSSVKLQLTYQLVDTVVSGASDRWEHRLGETLTRPLGHIGPVALDGRVALEQRLLPSGGEWGWRGRERLRAIYPLGHHIDLQVSEETIVSLNSTAWGQRAGITATRTAVGVRFPLSPHWAVSPGYNWQHVFLRGAVDRDDHIAALTFDFRY